MSSVVNFAISKCNSQTIGCNNWSSVWPTFEWKSRTKYSPPFPAPILAAKPFGTIENCLRYVPHKGQFLTKNISVQKHSLLRQGIIWCHYHCPSAPPLLLASPPLPPSCSPSCSFSPHLLCSAASLEHWSSRYRSLSFCSTLYFIWKKGLSRSVKFMRSVFTLE